MTGRSCHDLLLMGNWGMRSTVYIVASSDRVSQNEDEIDGLREIWLTEDVVTL